MAKINYNNKSQTASYAANKWNAQDANEVKASVNSLYDTVSTISDTVNNIVYSQPVLLLNSTVDNETTGANTIVYVLEETAIQVGDILDIKMSGEYNTTATAKTINLLIQAYAGSPSITISPASLSLPNTDDSAETVYWSLESQVRRIAETKWAVNYTSHVYTDFGQVVPSAFSYISNDFSLIEDKIIMYFKGNLETVSQFKVNQGTIFLTRTQ